MIYLVSFAVPTIAIAQAKKQLIHDHVDHQPSVDTPARRVFAP
jgi:hypothetical protein